MAGKLLGFFVAPAGTEASPGTAPPPATTAPALATGVSASSSPASPAAPTTPARPAPISAAAAAPARAAVLGDAITGPPVAAALATELRLRGHHATALVCTWGRGALLPSPGAASGGAARALASRLLADGHEAAARGRLAWVALPEAPDAAAGTLVELSGTVEAPVVLALAGARPAAFEALLGDLDLIVVSPPAGVSAAALELALADLARATPPVLVRRPLPRGMSRWLALSGRGRLRDEHDALSAALGAAA